MNILYSLGMDKPILSIIIPVYNVEKYIKQCLDSIFNQHVDNNLFEVIIVNDGTKDSSMNIISLYNFHTNLYIINQQNQGLSVARNNGLKAAKGEYVWFVDSDDWLVANSLNYICNLLKENGETDIFASVLNNFYESTGELQVEYHPTWGLISGKEYLKRKYRQGAVQRFIFNKKFLDTKSVVFFPNILHEDNLFGYQILYFASKVMVLNHPIYNYRIRESGSIMSSISTKTAYDLVKIHKMLISFMLENVEKEDQSWYRLLIYNNIDCIYGFCRGILSTNEFKEFYLMNKSYLKNESRFLLLSPISKIYAIRMIYFPITYMKFRYWLARLKKLIK